MWLKNKNTFFLSNTPFSNLQRRLQNITMNFCVLHLKNLNSEICQFRLPELSSVTNR